MFDLCYLRVAHGGLQDPCNLGCLEQKEFFSDTSESLHDWFDNTYTNITLLANRISQGTEEYHALLLLVLGCKAAPRAAHEDFTDDPHEDFTQDPRHCVIDLDWIKAFKGLKCRLLVDIIEYKLSHDNGTLTLSHSGKLSRAPLQRSHLFPCAPAPFVQR